MNIEKLYTELISLFLSGDMTREDVASKIADEIDVDIVYTKNVDLMKNCEISLRHIAEPNYWTTTEELKYYLDCLKGEITFSVKDRDSILK